jgi:hypothetical protein
MCLKRAYNARNTRCEALELHQRDADWLMGRPNLCSIAIQGEIGRMSLPG